MWMRDVNDRVSGWSLAAALVFLLSLAAAVLAADVSHNLPVLTRIAVMR